MHPWKVRSMFKLLNPDKRKSLERIWPLRCASGLQALDFFWLLLGLIVCVAPAWAGTVSFTDNFSPPSPLWSNTTGNWTATSGDYYAQVPNNNPGAVTLLPFDLTSYTLTTTVNGLGDGGIVVRVNSTDTQSIVLVLGGLGYGQGARGGDAGSAIYWGDSSNSIQGEVTGVFTPGDTYTITVKALGDTFSAYVNGSSAAVTTITDSIAGPDGTVGLYDDQPNTITGSGFGTPTTFSNFSLDGTTVPEPSTGLLFSLGLIGLAINWHIARRQGRPTT